MREASLGVEALLEFWEVDPGGDGGFEEFYFGVVFFVGVVSEVGVAWFDEDEWAESYLAEDGGEEDAGVDAVGLMGVEDLVEEPDVLHVGGGGGVGGAGDGGVGDAAVEGIVPDGKDLFASGVGAVLVSGDASDDALGEDVGEYLLDVGVVFVDVGGEEPAGVDALAGVLEGEWAFVDGAEGEVQVFCDDLFVVDVAGEGEVERTGLPDGGEVVVFPVEGGLEGVDLAFVGKDFLEGGDIVEDGGVDDDAEEGVVGRGGDLN